MSFNQQGTRLNQFVPNYQARSDYLPNKVVQVNENDKQQIVPLRITIAPRHRIRSQKRQNPQPEAVGLQSRPLRVLPGPRGRQGRQGHQSRTAPADSPQQEVKEDMLHMDIYKQLAQVGLMEVVCSMGKQHSDWVEIKL